MTNRDLNDHANGNAGTHGDGRLAVVLIVEDGGILQCPMGCCSQSVKAQGRVNGGQRSRVTWGWLPPTRVSWIPRSIALWSKCDVSKAFFTSSLSSWEAILDSSFEAAMMGVAKCGQQQERTSLWVADENQNPWRCRVVWSTESCSCSEAELPAMTTLSPRT